MARLIVLYISYLLNGISFSSVFCYLELVVALKRDRSHSLHSVRFDFFYELILICLGKERAIFIWISSFI